MRIVIEIARHQRMVRHGQDALERAVRCGDQRLVDLLRRRRALGHELGSTSDTFGVGTRTEMPSRLPFSSGSTRPMALAAPVDVGIWLRAARAR